jgi:prolyl 4-hydroxylase
MKTVYFLTLPVAATVLNLIVAAACIGHYNKATAQPVLLGTRLGDNRCISVTGEHCDEYDNFALKGEDQADDEEPMLQLLPGTDFKAYVRADVATFYGEEPGSRVETKPKFNGQAAKFINLSPYPVHLNWVGDNGEPLFQGAIDAWEAKGSSSFPGHKFTFTPPNKPMEVLCQFRIVSNTSVYYCNPYEQSDGTNPAHALYRPNPRSLEELSPEDRERYNAHQYNLEFAQLYKNFTGSEWLTMYPRNPPKHKIWRADYFGQTHIVPTNETHFLTVPSSLHHLSVDEMGQNKNSLAAHRAPGVMNMTIKAISCAPRAFEIDNFLSDAEVDHILDIVANQHKLKRSETGTGEVSTTRTSKTTWVPRHTDPVMDAVFRRVADALRMDEALLRRRKEDERPDMETRAGINEDLQIVHYDVGQEYTAHHDFGYDSELRPDSPSRFVNLCMYLNDVPEGGTTSFPRWRNAETNEPIHMKPKKGKAMIFYMLNPDGNKDDLSQHAANPVIEGEKWFANLWIHDPHRM